MMLHTIQTFRTYLPAWFPRSSNLGWEACALRFSTHPDRAHAIDKTQNPSEKAAEGLMSDTFAEGYASRSDEDGFGKDYGGNRSPSNIEMDKFIHENHPAYDKKQGSEATEKSEAPN